MSKRHELTKDQILSHALDIMQEYQAEGMVLTLRQMYYQFVARGISESGQLHYKRIGSVLTDARYSGTYPIEGFEDRGRSVDPGDFTRYESGLTQAYQDSQFWVRNMPSFFLRRARWSSQPVHVSVWVEKQALEGVFEPICKELGVSWFACKGYPSVSALYEWLKATQRAMRRPGGLLGYHFPGTDIEWKEFHKGHAERAVVLYFGDHDPDGWEIPRSAERNLSTLQQVKGIRFPVEFKRVALNMDQIQEYNPPPFEAKVSSARYQGYVDEHETEDAWELDALEPRVLRDLITTEVNALFDQGIHDAEQEEVQELREDLMDRIKDPDWINTIWDDE